MSCSKKGSSGAQEVAWAADEYSSADGMVTSVWGPATWISLHATSFNYPVRPTTADKKRHARWLVTVGTTLPCVHCRTNFPRTLRNAGFFDPASFDGREQFSRLVYRMHDEVNKMLGKPAASPPYEQVRATYEGFRARCLQPAELAKQLLKAKENGCTEPKYTGAKPQCVIRIVPKAEERRPFAVDARCVPRALAGPTAAPLPPSSPSA